MKKSVQRLTNDKAGKVNKNARRSNSTKSPFKAVLLLLLLQLPLLQLPLLLRVFHGKVLFRQVLNLNAITISSHISFQDLFFTFLSSTLSCFPSDFLHLVSGKGRRFIYTTQPTNEYHTTYRFHFCSFCRFCRKGDYLPCRISPPGAPKQQNYKPGGGI